MISLPCSRHHLRLFSCHRVPMQSSLIISKALSSPFPSSPGPALLICIFSRISPSPSYLWITLPSSFQPFFNLLPKINYSSQPFIIPFPILRSSPPPQPFLFPCLLRCHDAFPTPLLMLTLPGTLIVLCLMYTT